MPIECGCRELADQILGANFQSYIWLAAEAEDVVDTKDEWIVRCVSCGQYWRDGRGFRGIEKVPTPSLEPDR